VQRGSVSVAEVETGFGVSPMTARRDLDELARQGLARRTHGGAVLPGLSGTRTRSSPAWRSGRSRRSGSRPPPWR
jgi:DeoR/GlpR family transcriptional regulator of sugar metabolism